MTGINTQLISDCQNELMGIKNYIASDPFNSMVKYLVSYAVIKSCGTIELIFKDIIYQHLIQNANSEAISFFTKKIKESSSNPKTDRICDTLNQLNKSWSNSFKTQVNGSSNKNMLNSLVDLRNQLAHGNPISPSINDIINQFNAACNVLSILDSIVHTYPPV